MATCRLGADGPRQRMQYGPRALTTSRVHSIDSLHRCNSISGSRRSLVFVVFLLSLTSSLRALGFASPSGRRLHRSTLLLYSSTSNNSNLLNKVQSLNNDFCALRHGQSMANVYGVISSRPNVATKQHGLSPEGKRQAQQAGKDVIEYFQLGGRYNGIAILSSDYLRAKETAQCVADCILSLPSSSSIPLYQDQVILETRLRERWFGDWDGREDTNYHEVWKDDASDASQTNHGVESVDSVMQRATACVLDWDAQLTNQLILLVAHGDVLQITQTAFCKLNGQLHRTLEHLETATLRPIFLPLDQIET